ncbi:methylated-DNA--[protein]-cysteine S-methyltransferase [Bacteroides sp.]|uniref:methylated-DNA--[protein]-cysteine S-methyltransferase n=1 Tax=Bacteroides sp. TaxID=29523 RepID=UPI0025C086C1|nr:methylated-DNA--[protein]-cysteine S-methyltransferase [Bacteroides sp.]
METIQIQYYQSICGKLILGSFEEKLCMCDWMNEERRAIIDKRLQNTLHAKYEIGNSEIITEAMAQLDEYFSRKRTTFDIPLAFIGTDFQKAVWNELLNIPYRTTISYTKLSQRLNNPKAIRAVAAANGANPISIFVPCHRVIGSNHKLTGYGGGLAAKKILLELEAGIKYLL